MSNEIKTTLELENEHEQASAEAFGRIFGSKVATPAKDLSEVKYSPNLPLSSTGSDEEKRHQDKIEDQKWTQAGYELKAPTQDALGVGHLALSHEGVTIAQDAEKFLDQK